MGLVVERPGVLSKVQMLNLVLGVGVFSLLPTEGSRWCFQMHRLPPSVTGKSHPWTNTSVGGNFRRTFRTIGPYKFPQEKLSDTKTLRFINSASVCDLVAFAS